MNEIVSKRTLGSKDGRTIGYVIRGPQNDAHANTSLDRRSAVVFFYALGGCSDNWLHFRGPTLEKCVATVICVDRPGVGESSPLLNSSVSDNSRSIHDKKALERIRGHVDDVLAVLVAEGVTDVFILAECVGHPYAVGLCLAIIQRMNAQQMKEVDDPERHNLCLCLKGFTLVAPFVSTACPHAFGPARLGASKWVMAPLLYCITEFAGLVKSSMIPLSAWSIGTKILKKLVSKSEREAAGWTEEDFEEMRLAILDMNQIADASAGSEMRLATSPAWQELCDEFGKELEYFDSAEQARNKNIHSAVSQMIPVHIHVCSKGGDMMASPKAISWITNRCYHRSKVVTEEKIHSHEVMTFLGGPPRNPVLLHKILGDWGLLDLEETGL
mmetsp:Transcript_22858/g.46420  ORF Transcript_22858/g.46420 Transcript_22858/m.46420 type:complete len:385 (-) Transcript_22858:133-1287(-)|eukprot:CAMPEP_0183299654 /NCGR_PEP_ID=MMETSP0160_2-20130417/6325_1 /TAXON_ID=2839 ORGANISM="Odontella Sinensis, Strain Grunow 1884" /NCGR_SAMPLE_ID=MMETSP0160_2 /ASSEMBLY_ACC=CAM_ASM_000250 /LENGTH=384 /DNA_ID=CAMNT_0025461935 /DNA_START=60 /DNA_END=1214 /DNA_ORIENTATION=-